MTIIIMFLIEVSLSGQQNLIDFFGQNFQRPYYGVIKPDNIYTVQ